MTAFHPDLQAARYIPRYTMGPRLTRLMRSGELRLPPVPDDVIVEDVAVPGSDGEPQVSLRIYQPRELATPAPALFWTHGGGFIQGSPSQDEVAIMRDEVRPAFQLLVYPMLDDRTVLRTDIDPKKLRMWSPGSNRFGWASYLGGQPGSADVSPYAAPARRDDLSGLPPAWIGVGTLDLFHDEDLVYARRLESAGVPCEVHIVEGAFHGFDAVFRKAGVTRAFWEEQARALRAALLG